MRVKRSELKQWAREHLRGVENTLFPSFTEDMKHLDEAGIRLDVRQSIAHGFFSMMCATEVHMTLDEAKRFLSIAVDEAKGRIHVTASLIRDTLEDNRELMHHADAIGVDGILLGFPPTYHPQRPEDIYEVARSFCDDTSMYVTLYPSPHWNFEVFHPSGFPLDVLERLAELDNVVAVKLGEVGLFAQASRSIGDKVLLGCPIERLAPLLILGYGMQWMGAGCYEVFQSPETQYLVKYFNHLLEGNVDAGMEIYWKLTPARVQFEQQFDKTVMTGTYHWNQQKYYQWCVGGNGGVVRQPSMKLHQHEMEQTKMGFRMIGIQPRQPDAEFFAGRTFYDGVAAGAGPDMPHGMPPPGFSHS